MLGLNPHSGDKGVIGQEDYQIILPVVNNLFEKGHLVYGPYAADGFFGQQTHLKFDAVLAMYHDQGLPVLKYQSFGQAANITLGLPIIRTSVDHGTALDVAGTGLANAGSLEVAVQMASEMCSRVLG